MLEAGCYPLRQCPLMGAKCSNCIRKKKHVDDEDVVTSFVGDDDDIGDAVSREFQIDHSIGFNAAASRFSVRALPPEEDDEDFDVMRPVLARDQDSCMRSTTERRMKVAKREETDEFRVLRVSSLSGNITLYVAGGKHKKPVQYQADRVHPRAHEQPSFVQHCPFCPGNEHKTPINITSYSHDGEEQNKEDEDPKWLVRVIPNIFPMLICPKGFYGERHSQVLETLPHSAVARGIHANDKAMSVADCDDTCVQVDAQGVSEVFIESPTHNALWALQEPDKIAVLIKAMAARGRQLATHTWVRQLLFFKQYGPLSGGSLVHPHSQLISLPILPPPLAHRIEYSVQMYQKHGKCPTCMAFVDPFLDENVITPRPPSEPPGLTDEIIPEQEDAPSRLVHITEHFVVSVPYSSGSQYSMTVAPRRHSADFTDITAEEATDLGNILAILLQAVYIGLDDPSYNVFVRTAPCVKKSLLLGCGEISSQTLKACCHWILELRPRFPADVGGFEISSGVRCVSGLPEDQAADLRKWVQERLEVGWTPVKPAPPTPAATPVFADGKSVRSGSKELPRRSLSKEKKLRSSFNSGAPPFHSSAPQSPDSGTRARRATAGTWQRNVTG